MLERLRNCTNDEQFKSEVASYLRALSEDTIAKEKVRINTINLFVKREVISENVRTVILREIGVIHKNIANIQIAKKDFLDVVVAKHKNNKSKIPDSITHTALDFLEVLREFFFSNKEVNKQFGALLIFSILNNKRKTSDIISLLSKFYTTDDSIRFSTLMMVDIAKNNYEYFNYSSWAKLTSIDLSEVKREVSEILLQAITECSPHIESIKIKKHLFRNKPVASWKPQKRMDLEK